MSSVTAKAKATAKTTRTRPTSWAVRLGLFGFVLCLLAGVFAPLLSPHAPYEPASVRPEGMSEEDFMLMQDLGGIDLARKPPRWMDGGESALPLGTDEQARDLLSVTLHGLCISLFIGLLAVALQLFIGTLIGLIAGWRGGWADTILMRIADVQLSFSTLIVAIIALAVYRAVLGDGGNTFAPVMLVVVIGLAEWPQFARTVRASVFAEKPKEYVQAARVLGRSDTAILLRHILPNIASPLFVLSAIQIANAIMAEAALSFLGLGMPPDRPSLGALVKEGYGALHSAPWICLVPGLVLVFLAISVNLLGDGLRDRLDQPSRC